MHPKLNKVINRRQQMSSEGGIDWAYGELLAFGSLLMEGRRVRLTGQDTRRGTFVQRHSVFIDNEDGKVWTPLARSEEHTSELQSRGHLVCRLLLEKKNKNINTVY